MRNFRNQEKEVKSWLIKNKLGHWEVGCAKIFVFLDILALEEHSNLKVLICINATRQLNQLTNCLIIEKNEDFH